MAHIRNIRNKEDKKKKILEAERATLALRHDKFKKKPNKDTDIEVLFKNSSTFPCNHPLFHIQSQYKSKQIRQGILNNIDSLKKILHHTFDYSFLFDKDYSLALGHIAKFNNFYIRPIQSFKTNSKSRDKQFSAFLRHLFVKYNMPAFMDSVWLHPYNFFQEEYVYIGEGQSVYRVLKSKCDITRKMSHYFMQAPKEFSVSQAIRWCQAKGLGSDSSMAKAIAGSNLEGKHLTSPFWTDVIHLFVRNPMIDFSQISPLVDYISHEKNNNLNYSIKGRTINSLIKQMEEWHNHLNKTKEVKTQSWEGLDIEDWVYVSGKTLENQSSFELKKNQTKWTITQIKTGKNLAKEGKELKHCVYSYSHSCIAGRTSIWSMSAYHWNDSLQKHVEKKVLTIEVENNTKCILQVRGFGNRLAVAEEKNVLAKWAKERGLKF